MISICLNKPARIFTLLLFVWVVPMSAVAQGTLSLSVSPTLFEMTASPSQEWSSGVRVINANSFPMTVYVEPVNFEAAGESGQGNIVPILETETEGNTLAEWISIDQFEVTIPAEQTVNIPFKITVPEDAPPGGHFAAITAGTKPSATTAGESQVQTAQVVTSLVFLRVSGDVVESAQIRDFTTGAYINEAPEVDFTLRFQNKGNVHLRPQGQIQIMNMWGKERGVIPINKQSQFGNVLPDTIRTFTFSWVGDWSFADIGRYKAIVTLTYGADDRQFNDAEIAFWVLPWKTLLVVLSIVIGFILLVIWLIKIYIRRMLQMAGVTPELQNRPYKGGYSTKVHFAAPVGEALLDLRTQLQTSDESWLTKLLYIVRQYKLALLFAAALLVFIVLFVWYLYQANLDQRGYQVTNKQTGEVIDTRDADEEEVTVTEQEVVTVDFPSIALVNRSGVVSVLGSVSKRLQGEGYQVANEQFSEGVISDKTVIVYNPLLAEKILELQKVFPGALVSAYSPDTTQESEVTIYIGKDQK